MFRLKALQRGCPSTMHSVGKRQFSLPAHGTKDGKLVNRVLAKGSDEHTDAWNKSSELFDLSLTKRHSCDIELLLNGAFSPLEGFMTSDIYNAVCQDMHLPNGTIWPIPICLDISEEKALEIEKAGYKEIVLRDEEHNPIAIMAVEDIWKADKQLEGETVFGGDPEHPAVVFLQNYTKNMYIGGKLTGLQLPPQYDYKDLRKSPTQLRQLFADRKWDKVAAFQTRNPMHRAHIELTKVALASDPEMNLLIHPVVGMTKPGDIDHHTRVKCYKAILPTYPQHRTEVSVFPLAMRMGGPREAIWHSIIRKNYGCTHFIVGRDHAGPGANSKGDDFYGPYEARDAAVAASAETGMNCMSFEMMVYSFDEDKYYPVNKFPANQKQGKISGTEVRKRLRTGEHIDEWFSYPAVVEILRKAHPPRHKQGITVFFTGLSGSGKSTIANALREKLMELQDRRITMLDGDFVRKLISSELGFSAEHRNLNIQRIGFISSLIANSGGLVIAAPIAPYQESRDFARQVCTEEGSAFVEVFVSTPVSQCAQRDTKGLYAKAQKGLIKLTGMGDPYEDPLNPELTIDTSDISVDDACDVIIEHLRSEGYLEEAKVEKEAMAN